MLLLLLLSVAVTVVRSLPLDDDDDGGGGGGQPPTVAPGIADSPTSEQTSHHGPVVSLGFVHAFVASLSVIVVSELGDKTFFIAAIMAMRHSRITVFTGAISALALMTVLSGNDVHRCTDLHVHVFHGWFSPMRWGGRE